MQAIAVQKILRLVQVSLTLMLIPGAVHASTQVDQLAPEPDADRGLFGRHIALSGDTAAVGVGPSDPDVPQRPGSLRIFQRFGERWFERTEILRGTDRESYGGRVALDGDVLAVQLAGSTVLGSREPLISIYERQGGNWSHQQTLPFSGRLEALDVDDETVVAIDNTSPQSELNVIVRDGESWATDAVLPVGSATSVALEGGVIVAGDVFSSDITTGVAYVFEQIQGTWQRTATLSPQTEPEDPGSVLAHTFGEAVDVHGDVIVVGDTGRRSSPSIPNAKGSAHVFTKEDAGWDSGVRLLASNARDDENFGASVAIDDGIILIGAIGDGSVMPGSAYKFKLVDDAWIETERLVPAAADAGDAVGTTLALDDHTAMIGAPRHDDQAHDSGAVHVFVVRPPQRLACPGDIDHDGVLDLALVADAGVLIRNLDGDEVSSFPVGGVSTVTGFPIGASGLIDVEVMPDMTSDGAPELAVLTRSPLQTHVHDPFAAMPLSTTTYDPSNPPLDLELVPDRTGDGAAELAAMAGNPPTVRISDGGTGETLQDNPFSPWFYGQDLEVYPDLDSNGFEELAMLGEHTFEDRSDKVEIRNFQGAPVQEFWLGRGWRVLEQTLIADLNGNGFPEVAVRRSQNEVDNRVGEPVVRERRQVVLRDIMTREHLRVIDEGQPHFPTEKFFAISDINGNGSDEIVLFGRREGFGVQKARVIDTKTGRYLQTMYFEVKAAAQDLIACPDVNGNGAPELVLLGKRTSDAQTKAILRDARTGERLGAVSTW